MKIKQTLADWNVPEIGSNMMTVTCANPETYEKAAQFPEAYDLVRVRMGGWSEFFIAMFPDHQQHMMRRPLFVDGAPDAGDGE